MEQDEVSGRPALSEIVEAIRQLSPVERRMLQRRLRASGLIEPEEELTDRRRLEVAPALGAAAPAQQRQEMRRMTSRWVSARDAATNGEQAAAPPTEQPEEYRSPVSGKVVLGAPSSPVEQDPHAMPPLPGQAPEQPIGIIFDGGSRGNPGQGYGSYALRWPGMAQQIVQLRFGDRVTNNEAEYDTLIAAIEAVTKRLQDAGALLNTAHLDIRGDSLLVVNQVLGVWECKDARMQVRCDRVRELLQGFGSWQLSHHDRENSVRTLGH
jgi:ribonuclease HI